MIGGGGDDLGRLVGRLISRLDPAALGALTREPAAGAVRGKEWKRDVHQFESLVDPFSGEVIEVDLPLVSLVRQMWRVGIRTTASCERIVDWVRVFTPERLGGALAHPAIASGRGAVVGFLNDAQPATRLVSRWNGAGGWAAVGADGQVEMFLALNEVPAALELLS